MARKGRVSVNSNSLQSSPEYSVRVNPRARHVHLKLSWHGELEVVIPRGYNRRRIPDVIAARRCWLERARKCVRQQLQDLPVEHFEQRPTQVHLQAVRESFVVHYLTALPARTAIDERDKELRVSGPIGDTAACASALRAWLRNKARRHLAPWLRQTSESLGLPYTKVTIRSQRTRWGSCSARGTISLNCKLLFLPPAQVHYLFVHELCHTRHLNHSARYWALVERKLPGYRQYEAALRAAWRYVPRWAGE